MPPRQAAKEDDPRGVGGWWMTKMPIAIFNDFRQLYPFVQIEYRRFPLGRIRRRC